MARAYRASARGWQLDAQVVEACRHVAEAPGDTDRVHHAHDALRRMLFGRDDVAFSIFWEEAGGPGWTRNYSRFSQLAEEAAKSRVYGGIHFDFDTTSSFGTCGPLGDYIYTNTFADIAYKMDVCRARGLGPSIAVFEPGFMRVVRAYYDAGALPAGTLVKFYFSAGGYLGGGEPLWGAAPEECNEEDCHTGCDHGLLRDGVRHVRLL